ncbi:MAG TPA: hypothetical protein VMV94_19445 [Phycisphaerae bacterium]|nr:hypothetical protein [Phycisphaerae bacterium]
MKRQHVIATGAMMLLGLWAPVSAQETKPAGELGLAGVPPETQVLILQSDPSAEPVEPVYTAASDGDSSIARRLGLQARFHVPAWPGVPLGDVPRDGGPRLGCGDEGFTIYPYAVNDPLSLNFVWLNGNVMYGDDLTLLPGTWQIECYDVFIYADDDPTYGCNRNRTVTLRAHTGCNGSVIPGSQETWTVPPHGGPILLTGVTSVSFVASATIWFSLTTSINLCDGWYVSDQNLAGSTTIYVQNGTNCQDYIEGIYNKFHVVLYAQCIPPSITTQPSGGTVCAGQSYQFCVAASGTAPLSYQWQLNGANISGAASSCYGATQAGSYQCIVTNACGSATSNAATLTVNSPPTITSQPVDAAVCSGQSHQFCITASGAPPLSCQWQLNQADIPGATGACYTASQAGSYRCVVSNSCGSTVSNSATLGLLSGPTITSQPVGGAVCRGQPHQMCVEAVGTGTLRYQWKRNSLTIIGATASCYSATIAATYTCIVTDDCGPTVSTAAVVVVINGSGDLDGNGHCDVQDVPLFVAVLLGEDTNPAHRSAADLTCDGDVDGQDVQAFVDRCLGGP